MQNIPLHKIKTISEYHKLMGLPKPNHPLISLVNYEDIRRPCEGEMNMMFNFYSVSLKQDFKGKMKYGQQQCDFDEGILFFMSPGQVFSIDAGNGQPINHSGCMLLIHPDFLWNTPLAKSIKQYEYFSYAVSEGLFLSDKEETTVISILRNVQQEYYANIDKFSQAVIIAQIEVLLSYANRFYHRQFITRKASNHKILHRLEELLNGYFNNDETLKNGLPTVHFIAEKLNVSSNYLSGLLKSLTGQNTQQHIHEKLIEKAKEKLCVTSLSVSEIAYELGFGHPQSFSKLFKSKTKFSPLEFRASFN